MPLLLTEAQAFQAMRAYLTHYPAALEGIGEVGRVVTEMSVLDDGEPSDPAIWEDWLDAVRKVSAAAERMRFSEVELARKAMLDDALAYRAAYVFLDRYIDREAYEKKIFDVLEESKEGSDGLPRDEAVKEQWRAAVRDAPKADLTRQWIDPPNR